MRKKNFFGTIEQKYLSQTIGRNFNKKLSNFIKYIIFNIKVSSRENKNFPIILQKL